MAVKQGFIQNMYCLKLSVVETGIFCSQLPKSALYRIYNKINRIFKELLFRTIR